MSDPLHIQTQDSDLSICQRITPSLLIPTTEKVVFVFKHPENHLPVVMHDHNIAFV